MKSVRTKVLAVLSASMVFQVGGCSFSDVISGVIPEAATDLITTLIGV